MPLTIILSFVYCLILATDIYGYIDPGTGSYMLQLLIASFVGILFSVKIFWAKLAIFVKSIFSKKDS